MITKFESAGLAFVGKDDSGKRMEVLIMFMQCFLDFVCFSATVSILMH